MAESLNMTKQRLKLIKDNEAQRLRILELEDMNLGLTNENLELEAKLNKWINMQEQGYTAVAIENDLIVHAVQVLPNSIFTYTQDIPIEIGTALYSKIPFYELDSNGKMCIDTVQKIKHDSV